MGFIKFISQLLTGVPHIVGFFEFCFAVFDDRNSGYSCFGLLQQPRRLCALCLHCTSACQLIWTVSPLPTYDSPIEGTRSGASCTREDAYPASRLAATVDLTTQGLSSARELRHGQVFLTIYSVSGANVIPPAAYTTMQQRPMMDWWKLFWVPSHALSQL